MTMLMTTPLPVALLLALCLLLLAGAAVAVVALLRPTGRGTIQPSDPARRQARTGH